MTTNLENIRLSMVPPLCSKHPESRMVLEYYDRPGSPPGNGWICVECWKERKSIADGSLKHAKTRWPEGAEL